MEILDFKFELGNTNKNFNKIKNCRKVKPPYESDGYYSDKFFLDKRLGLSQYYYYGGRKFYQKFNIKNRDYYYYFEGTKSYIGTFNGTSFVVVTPSGFNVSVSESPKQVVFGRGLYGTKHSSGTTGSPTVSSGGNVDWAFVPGYIGGYVTFGYYGTTGIVAGDYIYFKGDTALKGRLNRVEYVDESNNIYIIGTDRRGTVPATGTSFDLYKASNSELGNTVIVGHEDGLSLVILDGYNTANIISVMETQANNKIIDVVNFDGNIFALTYNSMYFSTATTDDNTQFYPLDRYDIDGGYKLFPIGKALLAFGRTNKLFAAANNTTQNTSLGYVGYDVNYNGDLYSKYSFIFTDQSIYILQSDKQLKEISITQNNTTTFDLIVKDVLSNNKGLFNSLANGGEVFINSNQRYINFLYVNGGKTINFQYDKIYQDVFENEYNHNIYYFGDKILSDNYIFTESDSTFLDLTEEYSQEVNFGIDTGSLMYLPYIIRTIFGLVDDTVFDVNLDISCEIGGTLVNKTKRLNNFIFDNRLLEEPTPEELIEEPTTFDEVIYDGNIVSIQSGIYLTGRFFNFKYTSNTRFIIGNSYILTDYSKPFINEYLLTN